ncbi:neuroblastoma breakpoint family member 9-like [Talpa occidentalis]|uniref:neuroblastoma breakpoint family member 9-like n=1 Tax=Talpa occidentalis TaxID=50954 RepID=UPI0023F84C91|nr:neuroblastoma breakpoint family member 9-like [Talpa occidentalis]
MAACVSPSSDPWPGKADPDGIRELRSQLAQCKQNFRDLMEKFLVSRSTAYCLANQLQKHKCGRYKGLIESVLGEKLQRKQGRPAEKSRLAEMLRESCRLLQHQDQELDRLRQQVQEGRDVSRALQQHLEDLLDDYDPDDYEGFRRNLAKGRTLAASLVSTLSTEQRGGLKQEQDQEPRTPSLELRELDKEEGPRDEGQACSWTPPEALGSTDDRQPRSDDQLAAPAPAADAALSVCGVGPCSGGDGCPPGVPDSQSPQEEEGHADGICPRPSRELTALFGDDDPGDALDERYLVPSLPPDEPGNDCPPRSTATCSREDLGVRAALQVTENHFDPETEGGGHHLCPRVHKIGHLTCVAEEGWTLDGDYAPWEAFIQGPGKRRVSLPTSEVPAPGAQPVPCGWTARDPWLQVDRQLHSGHGQCQLHRPATMWHFATNGDSGKCCPLSQGEDSLCRCSMAPRVLDWQLRTRRVLSVHVSRRLRRGDTCTGSFTLLQCSRPRFFLTQGHPFPGSPISAFSRLPLSPRPPGLCRLFLETI